MFKNKLNYSIINLAALMIFLYIGVTNINIWINLLVKCASLLAPFIVAFVFAYAFTPLVRWLQKKGISKLFSILIVIFGILIVVVGIFALTLPVLYEELSVLIKTVSKVVTNFDHLLNFNLGPYEIKINDFLNDILKAVGSFASTTTMDVIGFSVGFIGQLIVGIVGFVYFLIDMDKIKAGVRDILKTNSKKTYEYVRLMDVEITNYLKGLEIFMVIQFFEYSLLFFLIGHPYWLLLGILACVTTVIPYFGGLITNVIAIILASVIDFKLFILTIVICAIFPQLDGYLISPKVYGKTNNVNPLITIMVVSVGGTLAGVVGIIAALPIYLLVRTTWNYFKPDLKEGMSKVKKSM